MLVVMYSYWTTRMSLAKGKVYGEQAGFTLSRCVIGHISILNNDDAYLLTSEFL